MSHHSNLPRGESDKHSDILSQIRNATPQQREAFGLGATGQFPDGKICEHDKGEIQFAIAGDPEKQLVHIDFGKEPIAFVSMTPQQAVELAQSLIKQARGASREPLTVVIH